MLSRLGILSASCSSRSWAGKRRSPLDQESKRREGITSCFHSVLGNLGLLADGGPETPSACEPVPDLLADLFISSVLRSVPRHLSVARLPSSFWKYSTVCHCHRLMGGEPLAVALVSFLVRSAGWLL